MSRRVWGSSHSTSSSIRPSTYLVIACEHILQLSAWITNLRSKCGEVSTSTSMDERMLALWGLWAFPLTTDQRSYGTSELSRPPGLSTLGKFLNSALCQNLPLRSHPKEAPRAEGNVLLKSVGSICESLLRSCDRVNPADGPCSRLGSLGKAWGPSGHSRWVPDDMMAPWLGGRTFSHVSGEKLSV